MKKTVTKATVGKTNNSPVSFRRCVQLRFRVLGGMLKTVGFRCT